MADEKKVIEIVVKAVGDADIKRLGRELQSLRKEATDSRKAVQGLSESFLSVVKTGKQLLGALGIGTSLKALADGFLATAGAMDDLADSAQKVGVAAEDLQKLRYAAKFSGVGAQELDTALKQLNKTLVEGRNANTDAAKALKQMGVDAGGSTLDAVAKIADEFAELPDGATKTARAMELFGRTGADLIPLLNEGGDAIREMGDELERTGGLLSTETLQAANDFNNNMDKLGTTLGAVKSSIVAGMLPALRDITAALTESARAGSAWTAFGKGIGEVARTLYPIFAGLAKLIETIGRELGGFAASFAAFVQGDYRRALDIAVQANKDAIAGIGDAWKAFSTELPKMTIAAPKIEAPKKEEIEEIVITASKAQAKAEESAQKQLASLRQQVANQRELTAALQESGVAYEELKELQAEAAELTKFRAELTEAGVDNADAQLEQMRELLQALREQKEAQEAITAQREMAADLEATIQNLLVETNEKLGQQVLDQAKKQEEIVEETKQNILDIDAAAQVLAHSLTGIFSGATHNAREFFRSILEGIAEIALQQAITSALGSSKEGTGLAGFVSGLFKAASGAALEDGRVVPFARGGIVTRPTIFPMARGMGLMGEAGPEAVMPLRRGADGKLGVQASAPRIEIINNLGVQASARVERGSDRTSIVLEAAEMGAQMAENRITRSMRTGYGPTSVALQRTYALRRRG
jgi:hypothetical protein